MIQFILGILLILVPLLLVSLFEDKKKGFFYIFSIIIGFILFLSLVLQFFHIFYYFNFLLILILLDVFIIFYIYKKKLFSFNILKKVKIDYIFILVFILLFFELYSVHFNYSGKVSFVSGISNINNGNFIYPYYSDEWSAISLIKYSLSSGSLAIKNPLSENSTFGNLEIGFHSFLSGVFLLLSLDPLLNYSYISLFFSLLLCSLIYFILKYNNISKINSAIACLFTPLIVNGVNLPGIWYLLPLTLGIICFLIGIIFISHKDKLGSILISILILIFYPPLFIFYTLSLFGFYLYMDKKIKIKYLGSYFVFVIIIGILMSSLVLFKYPNLSNGFTSIYSKLVYSTFTENAIPDYTLWKVIPFYILIFAFFGLFYVYKNIKNKLWFLFPLCIGLFYWFVYSKVLWRFIIEYQRDVVFTSILIIILSGFGLEYLNDFLNRFSYFKKYNLILIIQIIILIFLVIYGFNYTKNNSWEELKLFDLSNSKMLSPNAPATSYLISDDLKLFNFSKKRFLSIPWKSLVIGASTENYPMSTKPSTIAVKILSYNDFISANCTKKEELAKKYRINYIYSEPFNCNNFKLIGKSKEELYLYSYI